MLQMKVQQGLEEWKYFFILHSKMFLISETSGFNVLNNIRYQGLKNEFDVLQIFIFFFIIFVAPLVMQCSPYYSVNYDGSGS